MFLIADQLRGAFAKLCRNFDGHQQRHRDHLRIRGPNGGRDHN